MKTPAPRPPTVAALCLAAAWSLHRTVFAATTWRLGSTRHIAGLTLAAAGIALGAWCLWCFHRQRTTHHPFGRPSALVTSGPYRISRNPMYLAVALCLGAAALYVGTPIMVFAPAVFVVVMNSLYIPREEQLMRELFGEAFAQYGRRVRRWI